MANVGVICEGVNVKEEKEKQNRSNVSKETESKENTVSNLYTYYCKELSCKVNSSLLHYLRIHANTPRSLVKLSLSNNYLGNKGLKPVWKLLSHCDALQELDVEGNGLDNNSVIEMCGALRDNLMLSTLILNNNPISSIGGRVLLEYIQEHNSLTTVCVENTDIAESVRDRLCTALQVNKFQQQRTDKPQLISIPNNNNNNNCSGSFEEGNNNNNKINRLQNGKVGMSVLPLLPPNHIATLELLQSSSQPEDDITKGSLPHVHTTNYTNIISPIITNTAHSSSQVTVPLPALASKEKSIAPQQQLENLSAQFTNILSRSNITQTKLHEYVKTDTESLQMREEKDRNMTNNNNINYTTATAEDEVVAQQEEEEEEQQEQEEEPLERECEYDEDYEMNNNNNNNNNEIAKESSVKSNSNINLNDSNDNQHYETNKEHLPTRVTSTEQQEEEEQQQKQQQRELQIQEYSSSSSSSSQIASLTCLSTTQQFEALFTQGCREYGVHHLDAAYVAWNEAMQLALKTHNREWMAVLSNNLQQLSYELLVEEGEAHLASQALERADSCFAMALELAHKAHNASWENGMTEARRQVQEAVFYKCHEAALSLFTKAQEVSAVKCEARQMNAMGINVKSNNNNENKNKKMKETEKGADQSITKATTSTSKSMLTTLENEGKNNSFNNNDNENIEVENSEQFFLLPGTDVMVPHTVQFIDTWEWILLVQEAVRTWSEAVRVARKMRNKTLLHVSSTQSHSVMSSSEVKNIKNNNNGNINANNKKEQLAKSQHTLEEMINMELTNVASFLISHFFDVARPEAEDNELCWQHTSLLHYHECVLLSEVLLDMLSYSDQYLHHDALAGVVSLQLGNLYVASHQLALAERQFVNAITCGKSLNEPLFVASGLYFAALLSYQRANYGQAEAFLGEALVEWERLWSATMSSPEVDNSSSLELLTNAETFSNTKEQQEHRNDINNFNINNNSGYTHTCERDKISFIKAKLHVLLVTAAPANYVSLMHTASYRLLVQICVNTFRYREALEVLESMLVQSARDELYYKIQANFNVQPTLDQIAGISLTLHSPLLYYFLHRQYNWDELVHKYQVEEHVLIWAIPECAEMRFVDVNVNKDFHISLTSMINNVRSALHLDPFVASATNINNNSDDNNNNNNYDLILTTSHFPRRTWMAPLQALYTILVGPIKEYVKALCTTPQSVDSVWTLIPCEELRTVPFNALISTRLTTPNLEEGYDNGYQELVPHYWIEEVVLQMELSATHGALNALSALRLQRHLQTNNNNNNNNKNNNNTLPPRDIVVIQPAGELPICVEQHIAHSPCTNFEFDCTRSSCEGQAIQETWQAIEKHHIQYLSHHKTWKHIKQLCKPLTHLIVDEINNLRQLLPEARLLHFACPITTLCSNDPTINKFVNKGNNNEDIYNNFTTNNDNNLHKIQNDSCGALVTGGMHPELSLLTSHELSTFELCTPLAICSSTHLSNALTRNDVDGTMSILRALHTAQVPIVIMSQWCTPDMKPSLLFTLFYKLLFTSIHAEHVSHDRATYIDRDYLLNTNYQLLREDVTTNNDNDNNNDNININNKQEMNKFNLTDWQCNTTTSSSSEAVAGAVTLPLAQDTLRSGSNTLHKPIAIAVLLAHSIRLMLHNSTMKATNNNNNDVTINSIITNTNSINEVDVDFRYCPRKWAAYYCYGTGENSLV